MTHIVALRCIELEPIEGFECRWCCSSNSIPWVIKPQAVAAVLDVMSSKNGVESLVVDLSPESASYLDGMRRIPEWWPVEMTYEDDDADGVPEKAPGLFIPRRRKRRKAAKSTANTAQTTVNKESKKVRGKRLKKALHKAPAVVAFVATNMQKNKIGKALIAQSLEKMKILEQKAFPQNPSFTAANECMIPVEGVKGKTWEDVLATGFDFLTGGWLAAEFGFILNHFDSFCIILFHFRRFLNQFFGYVWIFIDVLYFFYDFFG